MDKSACTCEDPDKGIIDVYCTIHGDNAECTCELYAKYDCPHGSPSPALARKASGGEIQAPKLCNHGEPMCPHCTEYPYKAEVVLDKAQSQETDWEEELKDIRFDDFYDQKEHNASEIQGLKAFIKRQISKHELAINTKCNIQAEKKISESYLAGMSSMLRMVDAQSDYCTNEEDGNYRAIADEDWVKLERELENMTKEHYGHA